MNADSLSECRHPVADAILEYSKWKKLKEDVESRIHEIRPDGRIHGQFNPLGTDTGRVSSSEPNMQSITRGELRSAFAASIGNVLVIGIRLSNCTVILSSDLRRLDSGRPSFGREFSYAIARKIGQAREHRAEVVAER
jgi:DNA polymerase family A